MGLKSIINPWGHNLELERELAKIERHRDQLIEEIKYWKRVTDDLKRDLAHHKAATQSAEQSNLRLYGLIREAHFRNPATGRLGAKGEVFN